MSKKKDDPFAVLETGKKVSRAPYHWHVDGAADVMGFSEERKRGRGIVAFGGSPEDAHHIATWSPDVTAEVVELLRETNRLADRLIGKGGDRLSRETEFLAEDLDERIDALLTKVKERHEHE